MPGKFFKNILTKDKIEDTSLQQEFSSLSDGIKRTDGTSTTAPVSLIGIVDDNNVRQKPGFTPNSSFNRSVLSSVQPAFPPAVPNGWYGILLDSHIDSVNFKNRKFIETEDKFRESKSFLSDKSTRDRYLIFNDSSQDYFRHGFAINGRTPIKTAKNDREAWDGSNDTDYRLKTFKNTPYENEDPVMYGFEIIIDAISSPLLNGSIEDFIRSYSVISEVQSRRIVLYDFKKQFEKIFKTKGSIYFSPDAPASELQSKANNGYAQSQTQKGEFRPGKKAYLSHYLQKVAGLDFLIERNDGSPDSKSSFVNYGTDKLTLSFTEDVSGTLATLAHLYKLLYWSRPNGKNIVPENLLRFNCEIVVCEVRNFNRVRKVIQSNPSKESLEIIKDNVSRYIYSLRECQLFFNSMSHEKDIDLSNIKAYGDGGPALDVVMNFKYSTTKYERWVPDAEFFGQYVGYNNGAIWKIGNKGAREERSTQKSEEGGTTGKIADTSNPRFYTVGTNTIRHNGVTTAIVLDKIDIVPGDKEDESNFGPATGGNSVSGNSAGIGDTKGLKDISKINKPTSTDQLGDDEGFAGAKSTKKENMTELDIFKANSKKVAVGILNSAKNFVVGEINNQIKIRTKLLENTINKIKLSTGLGGLESGPKNVYPKPYTPNSFGPWFDVRKELNNFLTEDIAGLMGTTDPFQTNYSELNKLKPQNFGKSTNTIYDEKSKFSDINLIKFGNSNEKNKVYGTLENIIKTKSNPSEHNGLIWKPIGEKDFSKIGFGISNKGDHQKYPAPIIQNVQKIEDIVKSNTKWSYPSNNEKFGKK
jgi:hypothetical protein